MWSMLILRGSLETNGGPTPRSALPCQFKLLTNICASKANVFGEIMLLTAPFGGKNLNTHKNIVSIKENIDYF